MGTDSPLTTLATGFLALAIQAMTAHASEIRVIASPGVSAALKDIGPRFEHATKHSLTTHYGLVPVQKQKIESGEFDLAIVPSFVLEEGIRRGKIAADTRKAVARIGLAVGMRAGSTKPDINSVEAFKRAMINARSVTYVTREPAGMTITKGFERLGIAELMKAKTTSQENIASVWNLVASGEAEFGFGLISNALAAPGVAVAGPFPLELQYSVIMVAGIGTSASQADAARQLIEYLLTPASAALFKAKGLEPPTSQ